MKKQFTLLMKQSIIVSLFVMSALLTNAQSKHQTPSTKKNADRHLQTNQAEGFLPFEKQTNDAILFKTPNPLLNPKSLIQLYDSIYGYRWDTITNGWENQVNWKMINFVYDANHNLISYVYQSWVGNTWVNSGKNTFTYDANNNQTSVLSQYWSGSAWVNNSLYTFTYDANNNQTSKLYQTWSGSAWVNFRQYTYTYDANNNQTSKLFQTWSGGAWVNDWLYTFTYDANNNQTSKLSQTWSGGAWVNYRLTTYTYDANNFTQSYAHKYWNNTGTKISHGDSTYQCFHTVMGINSLEKNLQSVQLFPNPATNKITISKTADLQKETIVSIYNIQGEMVITNTFYYQNTMEMDVSLLAKGVYIVKIQSEKGVGSRKLVIQ